MSAKADEDEVLLANFERELSQLFNAAREKHFSSVVEPQSQAHFGALGYKLFQTSHKIRLTRELAAHKKAQLLFRFGEKFAAIDEQEVAQRYFFEQILAMDEATHSVDANSSKAAVQLRVKVLFASALCEFQVAKRRDPLVRFPGTLTQMVDALRKLQKAMEIALEYEKKDPQQYAWLVLNGTVLIFTIARPLLIMGFDQDVLNFFKWCVLSMNAVLSLCTSKHILWRVRLYLCICEAYHGMAQKAKDSVNAARYRKSALKCAEQADQIVKRLRKEEELDAPLPSLVQKTLDQAQLSVTVALTVAKCRAGSDPVGRKSVEGACSNVMDRVLVTLQVLEQSSKGTRQIAAPKDRQTEELLAFLFELLSPWLTPAASPSPSTTKIKFPLDLHLATMKHFLWANRWKELRVLAATARNHMEEIDAEARPMVDAELRVYEEFCQLREGVDDVPGSEATTKGDLIQLTVTPMRVSRSKLLAMSSALRNCAVFFQPNVASTCRDLLCAIATLLYAEYVTGLVNEIDAMSADALRMEIVVLTSELLLSIHLVFHSIELDDALLCGTVALKLGILLRERNKRRLAIQVLRFALENVNSTRDRISLAIMHNGEAGRISLGCASFTALLDCQISRSDCYSGSNARDSVGVQGSGAQFGALHQDLSCLQPDLCRLLFQIELEDACVADVHRSLTGSKEDKPLSQRTSLHEAWEQVLLIECRRNGYLRVLLQIEQIRLLPRESVQERESRAENCLSLLHKLEIQERELKSRLQTTPSCSEESDTVPRAPVIASRCSSSVSLLIFPFVPARSVLRKRKILYYTVYAREAGAGTEVSLNNTEFPGTAEPIFVDANTSFPIATTISGLATNEAYMFAVAAFDQNGEIIEGIGTSTAPVVALNPFPLPLLYGYLSKMCFDMYSKPLAKRAATNLYSLYSSQQGCCRPLWQANPLFGQALRVDVAARLPTALLNTIIETLSILCCEEVGDADRDGMITEKLRVLKPMQLQALDLSKKMSMAVEIALCAHHDEAVVEAGYKAYLHSLPLLHLSTTKGMIFQLLLSIFESLVSIPEHNTKDDIKRLMAHVGFEIFRLGRDHHELLFAAQRSLSKLPRDSSTPSPSNITKSCLQTLRECIALDNLYRGKDEWQMTAEVAAAKPPQEQQPRSSRATGSNAVTDGTDHTSQTAFDLEEVIQQSRWSLEEVFKVINSQLKFDVRLIEYICRLSAVAIQRREYEQIQLWLSAVKIQVPISPTFQEVLRSLGATALIPDPLTSDPIAEPENPSASDAARESNEPPRDPSKTNPVSALELPSHDEYLTLWCGEYFLIQMLLELRHVLTNTKETLDSFDGPLHEVSFGLLHPNDLNQPERQVADSAAAREPSTMEKLNNFPISSSTVGSCGEKSSLVQVEHFIVMLSQASASCQLFSQANAWQALQATCQFVWNGIWAAWISPNFFQIHPECLPKFSVCVNACLDMMDAVIRTEKDHTRKQLDAAGNASGGEMSMEATTMATSISSLTSTALVIATQSALRSRDDLWLSNFMLYALEVYSACGEWSQIVTTGLRFHALTGGGNVSAAMATSDNANDIPSTRNFSEKAIALIAFAQQQLVTAQLTRVDSARSQLAMFVANFEAAEAKKKKKKKKSKLVVQQTLSPEEIEFQQAKTQKESDLKVLQATLDQMNSKLASILAVQDALSKAKHKCIYALEVSQQLKTSFLRNQSVRTADNTEAVQPSMNQVVHAYKQCIAIGRQKRMTSLTTEALNELGDFFLACGDLKSALKYWNECVDNAFSTLNAASSWRALLKEPLEVMLSGQRHEAIARIGNQGFPTCLQSCAALTKMALQASGNNIFQTVEYARMTAAIFEALYQCSLPHPVLAFLYGSYVMNEDFWPGRNMFSDAKRLPVFGVGLMLMFIPEILVRFNFNVDAMPLVTAYEQAATFAFHSLGHTVNAKRLRLEALVNENRLDEAAVVIRQLLQGIELPLATRSIVLRATGDLNEITGCAFHVNRPLQDSTNAALLVWISKLELAKLVATLAPLYGSTLALLVTMTILRFCVAVACKEQLTDVVNLRQTVLKCAIAFYQSLGPVREQTAESSTVTATKAPASARLQVPPISSRSQPTSSPTSARDSAAVSSTIDATSMPSLNSAASAEETVRIPSEVLLLQSKLAFAMGQWSQSRTWSMQAIRELPINDPATRSDMSIGFTLLKQSVITTLQCRLQIIKCDLAQSLLNKALAQVELGMEEALAHGEKHFELELRVYGVVALVRLGERVKAEKDAIALRQDFRQCFHEHSMPYITLLQILSDLNRSNALGKAHSSYICEAKEFIVEAVGIVDTMLTESGWIGITTNEREHRVNLYRPLVATFIRLKSQLAQLLLQSPLEATETLASRRLQTLQVVEDGIRALDHTINPLPAIRAQLLLLKGAAMHRSPKNDPQLLEESIQVLRTSIETSITQGGHDRELIRGALMELVELFQNSLAANNHKEIDIQAAFHYLLLALQIQEQTVRLVHTLQLQETSLTSADKLPTFIATEVVARAAEAMSTSGSNPPPAVAATPLSPRISAAESARKAAAASSEDLSRLANYFLRLLREKELLPNFEEPHEQLLLAFHSFLIQNSTSYAKLCCFAQLPAVPTEDPEIKGGFVCACFAPNFAPAITSHDEEQPQQQSGDDGQDRVRLYFTCGPAVLDAPGASDRFATTPVFNKSHPVDTSCVRSIKNRCSSLRIEMEDDGSLLIDPASFEKTFVGIAHDIQVLLDPSSQSKAGLTDPPIGIVDALANAIPLECTKETVMLLEDLFDLERGVQSVEQTLCYFLRDALERNEKTCWMTKAGDNK